MAQTAKQSHIQLKGQQKAGKGATEMLVVLPQTKNNLILKKNHL